MIRSITSDLKGFKSLKFNAGLNILLADRLEKSGDRDSRNAVGKSSLITIIDFLLGGSTNLGGSAHKQSILCTEPLASHSFTMSLDVGKYRVRVTRSGASPKIIRLRGIPKHLLHKPTPTKSGDMLEISNEEWQRMLGRECFGVTESENGTPSFRQLFPYFARRESQGGMLQPTRHSKAQQEPNERLVISYLLDLDWRIPIEFENLRTEKKHIDSLKRALKDGALRGHIESVSRLGVRLAEAKARLGRLEKSIAEFRVVKQYQEIAKEADALTATIQKVNDEDTVDRVLIRQLEAAMSDEAKPEEFDLKQMYGDASFLLPKVVHKRFQEVTAFHERVIANRRKHLLDEIERAKQQIVTRAAVRQTADARRSKLMAILQSGGALDTFHKLQAEASELSGQIAQLEIKHQDAKKLSEFTREYKVRSIELQRQLELDMDERSSHIGTIRSLFSEYYERQRNGTAILNIDPSEIGPRFSIEADDKDSRGIKDTLIFSFDILLASYWASKQDNGRGLGFLVHDSHLFSDMDERQVVRAIRLGAEVAEESGFQYIVTMNSDAMHREEFGPDFDVDKYILSVRLTDQADGGLFGRRFASSGEKQTEGDSF